MKFNKTLWCFIYFLTLAHSFGATISSNETTSNPIIIEQQSGNKTSSSIQKITPSSLQQRIENATSAIISQADEAHNAEEDENEPMNDSASALSLRVDDDDDHHDIPKNIADVGLNKNKVNDEATSPSMTSVHHQVWTSSSSGSLDELSPEIISKLRGDVPFLAAYALRPRLVGASSISSDQQQQQQQQQHQQQPQPQLSSSNQDNGANGLQTSASQQRQSSSSSHLPLVDVNGGAKLSDFNELKVETSSLSKSEHHHKRKTTLKKQPSTSTLGGDLAKKRRLILAATSKLMIERRKSKNGSKKSSSLSSKRLKNLKKRSKSRRSGRLSSRASNSGINRKHRMRSGRQQQQQISPAINKLSPDGKTNDNDDGVKGGGSRAGVEPFYKRRKGAEAGKESTETTTNDLGDDEKSTKKSTERPIEREKTGGSGIRDDGISDDDDGDGDDEDEDQLEPPEPRRVGDPDVDEVEGDTVTVMPKFDGVDDDPEIPIEDNEQSPAAKDDDDNVTKEDGSKPKEPEEDPRGNRVNREKSADRDGGSGSGSDDSMVLGGGLGATTGNSGSPIGGEKSSGSRGEGIGDGEGGGKSIPGVELADKSDDGSNDDNDKAKNADEDNGNKSSSDVDEDDDDHQGGSMGGQPFDSRRVASDNNDARGSSRTEGRNKDDGDRRLETEINRTGKDGKNRDEDSRPETKDAGDDDREEIDDTRRSKSSKTDDEKELTHDEKEGRRTSKGNRDHDQDKGDKDHKHHGSRTEHHDTNKLDCDHNGHDYDEHHHHHHHSHHDGIKWLQDAIPGEPGQDYPILSEANITNFNCRDQKYAGYYADVEARCQVFHICQLDGRQDSFLCPNGTIFSQISRVCVWWNSFDCEDAPKFYALNAQLYTNNHKQQTTSRHSSSSSSSPSSSLDEELRPLDMARINTNRDQENNDDEDSSSIDSLIKAMKHRKTMMGATDDRRSMLPMDDEHDEALDEEDAHSGARGVMMNQARRNGEGGAADGAAADGEVGGRGLSDEDEASIQRKSTKLASVDEEEDEKITGGASNGSAGTPSSRLRHNGPRRQRRASSRQAPPKLKARGVRAGSRRRKLRIRIRPKRRT